MTRPEFLRRAIRRAVHEAQATLKACCITNEARGGSLQQRRRWPAGGVRATRRKASVPVIPARLGDRLHRGGLQIAAMAHVARGRSGGSGGASAAAGLLALLWPDLTLERVRAGLDDPGLVREALTAADPQAARLIYGGE